MSLLQQLEDDYNQAKKEKEDLENQVDTCSKQLERAEQLLSGLGGEKKSWGQKAEDYRSAVHTITGDVCLCSGIIAYLGAFYQSYRHDCIEAWKTILLENGIPFTEHFSIQSILADENSIGTWVNAHKLPNDTFSIDNAIILKHSKRWYALNVRNG